MFLVAALSLAGIPPFSGFISKFGADRGRRRARQYAIVAVSLVVSLLTLFSMIRIWIGAFWSPPEQAPRGRPEPAPSRRRAVPHGRADRRARRVQPRRRRGRGPDLRVQRTDRADLLDRDSYVDEVLPPMRIVARVACSSPCGCSPGASSASPTS